jgi:isopentenyl-diphosphate delta-isomerase
VHTDRTELHRGFSCFVFDIAGRFLLTRRAPTKPTFPGVWTNSFCGHPAPAERGDEAVHRRARQELRIALVDVQLALPDFRFRAEMNGIVENEICPVYLARTLDHPEPDPAEVDAHRWVRWADVVERARSAPESLSPWCVTEVAELAAGPAFDGYELGVASPR